MRWPVRLLIPIALFATVNDLPRFEFLSGYRNDLIHWHLTQEEVLCSSERTRNIQFWENILSFQMIHRDIAVYVAGGYGAFGRGALKERITDSPKFTFSTQGWAVDGTGYLGCAVNLTPDRTYRVILLPLIGFSGHYECMHRPGFQVVEAITLSFPKNYQQTWYGPLIGAGFQIEPGHGLLFQVGYAYHWLDLRISAQSKEQASSPYPAETIDTLRLNRWGNFGHSGWVEAGASFDRNWRCGAALEINYYFSGNHLVGVKQSAMDGSTKIRKTFKLRWSSISGFFTISRSL